MLPAAENVQVVVRMRPKASSERGQPSLVSISGESQVTCDPAPSTLEKMGIQNKASLSRTFTYDRAFGESTSQERLFNESVAPVVDEVLRGYSCTVFCYGQTGTGKTYTMEGPKRGDGSVETEGPDAGIIPRSIKRIFAQMPSKGEEGCDWVVKVSFLEIYNEKLDDLLSPEPSSFQNDITPMGMGGGGGRGGIPGTAIGGGGLNSTSASGGAAGIGGGGGGSLGAGSGAGGPAGGLGAGSGAELKLVNDDKMGVRVAGLEEIQVSSPKECFEHLARSISKRATAETKCNAASSRSHCVFTITITTKESFDGEDTLRVGKLNLVDLAGSECVGRSGATDKRAREAGNINQSLLTLGRVITALVEGMPHVPYRDSKLTRLLQDSLGGKTKTCMIATVSPATGNMEETLSTLEYAARAKFIRNRPEACARVEKRDIQAAVHKELTRMRERYRAQIDGAAGAKGYVYIKEEEELALRESIANLERSVSELEELKAVGEKECLALRACLSETKCLLEATTARAQAAEAELASTTTALKGAKAALIAEETSHEGTAAVRAAAEHTVGLLSSQAQEALEALGQAVEDVGGLRSKVARTTALLCSNKSSGDAFAGAAAVRLAGLMASVEEHGGGVHSLVAGLQGTLAAFHRARGEEGEAIGGALGRVKAACVGYTRSVGAGAGGLGEEVGRGVGEGGYALGEAAKAAKGALGAGLQALEEGIAGVEGGVAAAQGRVTALGVEVKEALAHLTAGITAFATATTTATATLLEALERSARSEDLAWAAAGEAAHASRDAITRTTSALVEELSGSFTAALAGLGAKVIERAGAEASAQCKAFSASRGAAAGAAGGMKEGIVALGGVCTTWVSGARGSVGALVGSVGGGVEGISRGLEGEEVGKALAATRAASQTWVGEVEGKVATLATTGIAALGGIKTHVGAYVSKARSGAVSGGEVFVREFDSVGGLLATGGNRVEDVCRGVREGLEGVDEGVDRGVASVKDWAVGEGCTLAAFFGTTLTGAPPPTGATPIKRAYTAPKTLVATSPEDTIKAKWSAAREDPNLTAPQRIAAPIAGKEAPPSTTWSPGKAEEAANAMAAAAASTTSNNSNNSANGKTTSRPMASSSSTQALLSLRGRQSTTTTNTNANTATTFTPSTAVPRIAPRASGAASIPPPPLPPFDVPLSPPFIGVDAAPLSSTTSSSTVITPPISAAAPSATQPIPTSPPSPPISITITTTTNAPAPAPAAPLSPSTTHMNSTTTTIAAASAIKAMPFSSSSTTTTTTSAAATTTIKPRVTSALGSRILRVGAGASGAASAAVAATAATPGSIVPPAMPSFMVPSAASVAAAAPPAAIASAAPIATATAPAASAPPAPAAPNPASLLSAVLPAFHNAGRDGAPSPGMSRRRGAGGAAATSEENMGASTIRPKPAVPTFSSGARGGMGGTILGLRK